MVILEDPEEILVAATSRDDVFAWRTCRTYSGLSCRSVYLYSVLIIRGDRI